MTTETLTVLDPPPARFGAAMGRRFGLLYHLLGLGRGVGRTRLEDPGAEAIRAAAERGPVLYVLPRASALDHLALNAALASRRLPLSVWAPGMRTGWWHPLADAWDDLRLRARERLHGNAPPDPVASGWVAKALASGSPVTLFLEGRKGGPVDPFEAVVDAAALRPPVQVVPLMVVWDRAPEVDTALHRFFFAKSGVPGLARRVWRALSSADAFVHVGRPIELPGLAERVGVERLPGVLRRVVARALRQESKVVAGPRLLPHRVMRRLVLENPPMRDLAKREAAQRGVAVERVRDEMSDAYDRIAARFSWTVIQMLHVLLRPLWTTVYGGVDARPEDVDRIRAAMRDGTAVLVPCHKSHVDYVLMSWLLYEHDLVVPHVVAGLNLAVWPVSVLLRGAGGFFVKRSFAGDRVFPAVFARYLRELVRQEYPVEFFVEGGRTRSGKLLPPKLGVLGMVVEAAEVRSHGREVTILPIAFAYEQVAEEGAYAREQGGERKRPESLGELFRARAVLSRRYGRVYLRVGDPVRCGSVVDGPPRWSERPPEERRQLLQALGDRIVHRIGQAVVLLPTTLVALALLAHPRRAVRHAELIERITRLDALLTGLGVARAASLARFDLAVSQALDRFVRDGRIEALEHGGERIWSIVPDQRLTLDYAKNQVLHFLAAAGLAACALRASPEGASAEVVGPRFHALRHLWRREFVWDPDESADDALARGLADLARHGAVRVADGGWHVADVVRVGEVYGLFRALLEAYRAVVEAGALLPASADELPAALQRSTDRLLAAGTITRPEATAIATLQNAVEVLRQDGVLRAGPDGRLALDPDRAAEVRTMLGPMT